MKIVDTDIDNLSQWLPSTMFEGVDGPVTYGCRLPASIRHQRAMDKLCNWRSYHGSVTIVLHPDHYAWIQRELMGLN